MNKYDHCMHMCLYDNIYQTRNYHDIHYIYVYYIICYSESISTPPVRYNSLAASQNILYYVREKGGQPTSNRRMTSKVGL